MNVIDDLFFKINKPKLAVITGLGRFLAKSAITEVLKNNFKPGKDIILIESDLKDEKTTEFLIKNSALPLLVATGFENISESTRLEYSEALKRILRYLPEKGIFLANFDDENMRQITSDFNKKSLTFGFQEGSDLMASDMFEDNFKINYQGSTVPVWLEKISGKEQIYAALAAASCGIILGMNLIEISQALKSFSANRSSQH
jgi:UDP-N-acetylmuramate-alanine ligase